MNVLILGAHSDVAKALAHEFARHGYDIWLAGRRADTLSTQCADLEIRHKISAHQFEFDARNFASHQNFYKNLPGKPDVVIAVFGYLGSTEKGLEDWEEAINIIETNYTGAVSILNIAAVDMMTRKSGTIIGISSVAGERGRQSNFLYGSAKAGFSAYLSGLRNKLFHRGVHVLTVKPGFIDTAMTAGMPLNPRLTAKPKKVAVDIYKAYKNNKNVLFTLWMWKHIMCIIRNIPEPVFKKLKL